MSEQFIGEIRWFPYGRGAPTGWQACDGSLLSIQDYETLYTLLGTTYGGDGVTNFGVPDLRGRVALNQGSGAGLTSRSIGETGGSETVTLTVAQMPAHAHALVATGATADSTSPVGNLPAALPASDAMYVTNPAGLTPVATLPSTIGVNGGSLPHQNCAPTLAITPCIATEGTYPSRP